MFKSHLFAVVGAALALVIAPASPTLAQEASGYAGAQAQQNNQAQEMIGDQNDRNARDQTGRRTGGRQGRSNRDTQPEAPTPEQNMAAAQAIATAASLPCQVTQANFLGMIVPEPAAAGAAPAAPGASARAYEAACATGPGYILIASTPPQSSDCTLLLGQAEILRRADPAADVGTQCVIPQNLDTLRVLTGYAADAGVACTVDEGASIGRTTGGNVIYEIGCNGVDGLWLEREPNGWKKTECATVITQNAVCRFSTVAEQAATLKARFAGNAEAAACDVTQGRYMGANANGSFYEAKCSAGNGVIVRFDPAFAVQQVYPCEVAHRIGGGCTLTIVPPPAETAAPASQ